VWNGTSAIKYITLAGEDNFMAKINPVGTGFFKMNSESGSIGSNGVSLGDNNS